MATYVITGWSNSGSRLASVMIDSIDQDTQVSDDMTFVNAIRAAMATGTGVYSVVAQKYEQVVTTV